MTIICPSILAVSVAEYDLEVAKVKPFARRIQVDLTDNNFAPSKTIDLKDVSYPDQILIDVHLMQNLPGNNLALIKNSSLNLVIVHAEANPDSVDEIINNIDQTKTKLGIALLPKTDPHQVNIENWLKKVGHCLIFAGHLGYYGGEADFSQLDTIQKVKAINPNLEIGWDGGVNPETIRKIIEAGADVLNVGAFIQKSESPQDAYAILEQIASEY